MKVNSLFRWIVAGNGIQKINDQRTRPVLNTLSSDKFQRVAFTGYEISKWDSSLKVSNTDSPKIIEYSGNIRITNSNLGNVFSKVPKIESFGKGYIKEFKRLASHIGRKNAIDSHRKRYNIIKIEKSTANNLSAYQAYIDTSKCEGVYAYDECIIKNNSQVRNIVVNKKDPSCPSVEISNHSKAGIVSSSGRVFIENNSSANNVQCRGLLHLDNSSCIDNAVIFPDTSNFAETPILYISDINSRVHGTVEFKDKKGIVNVKAEGIIHPSQVINGEIIVSR